MPKACDASCPSCIAAAPSAGSTNTATRAISGTAQQLEPFAAELRCHLGQPRDVSPWLGKTGHKSPFKRITNNGHDNGDGLRRLLGRTGRWTPRGHNHCDVEPHQLSREWGQLLQVSVGIAVLNND